LELILSKDLMKKCSYAVFMLSAASEAFGSPSTRYISFLSPHLYNVHMNLEMGDT
jgi:hypothetical protein